PNSSRAAPRRSSATPEAAAEPDTPIALAPCDTSPDTVSRTASASRPLTTTRAPSSTRVRATARPIPRLEPVTTTTRSASGAELSVPELFSAIRFPVHPLRCLECPNYSPDTCPEPRERLMTLRPTDSSTLLIDGKLVPGNGGTFAITDPTTEELLGHAAEGTEADMDAAIAAARRAFDDTDWSRDHAFRGRCLRQLRDALREHIEELREITIAEVGAPRFLTSAAHLEGPIDDLLYFADLAESYAW